MSDPNFSAIRARLRYENVDEFIASYGRYISRRGMFLPMAASKLKPVGTTVRFQLLLADGTSAMLGEGVVRKLKGLEDASDDGPVGMLVKFSKLSPDSKRLVDRVVKQKADEKSNEPAVPQRTAQSAAASVGASAPEDGESTTGVLAAEEAEQLVGESSAEQAREAPPSAQTENQTREVELPVDDETEQMTSGDEVFGDTAGEPGVADDQSEAVAEALADSTSDTLEAREQDDDPFDSAADSFGTPRQSEFPGGDGATDEQADYSEAADDPFAGLDATESGDDDPFADLGASESGDATEDLFSPSMEESQDNPFAEPAEDKVLEEQSSQEGDEPFAAEEPETVEAFEEPEAEPAAEQVGESAESPESDDEAGGDAEAEEPQALAESEGGLKVMAYDESDLDDEAAREFEEFAFAGEEDEVDEMFDNIFGGGDEGDDGGLFGDGGEDGDFFGGGDDDGEFFGNDGGPADVEDAEADEVEAIADEESEAGLAVDSEFIVGEEQEDPASPPSAPKDEPPSSVPSEPPSPATPEMGVEDQGDESPSMGVEDQGDELPSMDEPLGVSFEEQDDAQLEASGAQFDLPDDDEMEPAASSEPEDDDVPVSIREHDGDSSEHIQSLLSMDDEEQEESELTLNIGGGKLDEESSEAAEEEDPDDSMEILLATAKEELESKKKAEEQEDDDKDILDELLGDEDDLPAAGPAPLDLPDPEKKKKKKKGFISKFFGGDD